MYNKAHFKHAKHFESMMLLQGYEYFQKGQVLHIRLSEGLLKGRVKDQSNDIYDVHMDLKAWPQIPSRCGCEYKNCKHAAACLFALRGKEQIDLIFQTVSQVDKSLNQWLESLSHTPLLPEKPQGPPRLLDADEAEWYSDLQETKTDFFSYQLGILVDGRPISILPLVIELIQQHASIESQPEDQPLILSLPEGLLLSLPFRRIKPLIRLILQLGLQRLHKPHLLLNSYQLLLVQETELALNAIRKRWQGATELRTALANILQQKDYPKMAIPQGLRTTLRHYQHEGLDWLQLLRRSRFNGILADEMGLGKTVQVLAHLLYEKEQGRLNKAVLILTPRSLIDNWLLEAARFTPALKVLIYHGNVRYQDQFDDYDLVISTYGLIHRDKDKFLEYPFHYLILDEAQCIKNAKTKTTQIIQQLNASHRLCLTGTPLENHLGELWSLFHFLMPGLLGDAKQFKKWFRTPIEKHGDIEKRTLLAQRVLPFILRRTKNQVAFELPPKTEMLRKITLQGAQRDLYEAIRLSMEDKVRSAVAKQGLAKNHILLFDALLKLRQICCDPRLLSLSEAKIAHGTSGKLEALMELLDNLMSEKRRVLIFSQFTSMLKLIEEQLLTKNYAYLKLTGQTQNRQEIVDEFQAGKSPIFLISLKAGGTGLNLTKADTVIHYDPWWNPAVEQQATDRTHRIGQENPVFVYKLIAAGTVEEAILGMQEKKKLLLDGILSLDPAGIFSLSEDDLDKIFMPMQNEEVI